MLLFILKGKVVLFCTVYLSSLNFSSLIGEIFVKTQNFDSYDVVFKK